MWHIKVQKHEQEWQNTFFFLHEVTLFRLKTQSNKYAQQISLAISEFASKGNQEETWHISKDKKDLKQNKQENSMLLYSVQMTSLS